MNFLFTKYFLREVKTWTRRTPDSSAKGNANQEQVIERNDFEIVSSHIEWYF